MASFVRVGEALPVAPAPSPWRQENWAEQVEQAVQNGTEYLLSVQSEEGYWHGELEADTTLESDYIYYLHVLGKATPERIEKLANYVRRKQLEDGGWPIYPGGPSELNATTKAYFALKLAGDSPDAPHMAKARETVHGLGGLEYTNSYVRFYLALVGAVEWELVPAIPPELMLLPHWFYFNIYEMSSWTRGIVIPMAILSSLRPEFRLPEHARVDELFKDPTQKTAAFNWSKQILSWK
ncbi:MAG TPA: prenyltransferase/squalene oxidase repeat-containing protein, partial [Candidatus Sulfotelmatobacter sp.]|nr:prenyltransferase/squalene oxidase repeat-containing protein [Candidatus Sulfotelmatobacter sp.]